MSAIVEFYRGSAPDTEGRHLADILSWPDAELELVHDFIQWLFPLPQPSQFNPDAPLLTAQDISAFHSEPVLRDSLAKSFRRMLRFLGLALDDDSKVVEGPNFAARTLDVWSAPNHNWLRITRILRSLHLLGLETQAQALYDRLRLLRQERRLPISAETFRYWTEAVK